MIRRLCLLFFLLFAAPALAEEAVWLPFGSLPAGERQLAESVLADMFGGDPALWPDWLEPRAALVPTGSGTLLVVRQPVQAPCGQYRFTVFAPVSGGRRARLGPDFCAGQLTIVPLRWGDWPDLQFSEGWVATGDGWRREDRQLRWNGSQWMSIR